MLWGGLELAAKGPDLGEDSLGKQSRRKSIVQPFRIFYSLLWGYKRSCGFTPKIVLVGSPIIGRYGVNPMNVFGFHE
jgi:hypothetical protein